MGIVKGDSWHLPQFKKKNLKRLSTIFIQTQENFKFMLKVSLEETPFTIPKKMELYLDVFHNFLKIGFILKVSLQETLSTIFILEMFYGSLCFCAIRFKFQECKTPNEKKKCLCFFALCAFWRCSTGLFAFVPLDLNFTNPKSTIFEPGWKTQPFPANHDQITKYNLMFFYK